MKSETARQVFLIDRQHWPRHHDPGWCPACQDEWPCEIHFLVHPECRAGEHQCQDPL